MRLGLEIKVHGIEKNALPCLLDTLSVFVWRILAVSVRFQWVLGSLFCSLYTIAVTQRDTQFTTSR